MLQSMLYSMCHLWQLFCASGVRKNNVATPGQVTQDRLPRTGDPGQVFIVVYGSSLAWHSMLRCFLCHMEDDAQSIWSIQGHNGDAEELDDDGWVNLELYKLDGELVHTIRVVSDASVGNSKAKLKAAGFTSIRYFAIKTETFNMNDDYKKFMLTKVAREAMLREGHKRTLKVNLVS